MRANYKVELASGIFILLGIGALIWLATKATNYGQEIGEDAYFISARFTNVADLKDRAPVKIGGVMVGKVESIELDPLTFEAQVTMRFADQVIIGGRSVDMVSRQTLLRDRYLPRDPELPRAYINP